METTLLRRTSTIFSAITVSFARILEAVFMDGDLKNFPRIVLPGPTDYNLSISAFFDNGNFFYGTPYTIGSTTDLIETISARLLQLLTGVVLIEANWYVLKDAYTADNCPTNNTGRVVDGSCFTLEHPGLGGKAGGADRRGEYSLQMDEATLDKVYLRKVVLEDLYRSSNDCQKKSKAYNTQGSMPITSFQSEKTKACFYNLPVLTVTTHRLDDIPYKASPCSVYFANKTAVQDKKEPEVGVTYLPPNLDPIFSEPGFCTIDKFTGNPGTD
ncbi:hypothetical protein UCRPA7_3306 [Phaeoacremonium minimum UCRPA7]|uniref:Uncharacterized protein n=1 Tax=Phaeoacremonium minimum (strain UCR-PA7) TaxID=1286976 RepID=R8BPC1_PHAM7|nr:hypothetical protein UCRPA7_3306 [Phaeoacremonium minimum UCRPA7]EOO01179.1 hypothetical protein UCRPA7_3306 [Phaeoacremonium minimum UCRPA7]